MDRGEAEDLGTWVRGAAEEVEEKEVVGCTGRVVGDAGVEENRVGGREEGGGRGVGDKAEKRGLVFWRARQEGSGPGGQGPS